MKKEFAGKPIMRTLKLNGIRGNPVWVKGNSCGMQPHRKNLKLNRRPREDITAREQVNAATY